MRAMGSPGALYHLAPVLRAGEDLHSLIKDLARPLDDDASAVRPHHLVGGSGRLEELQGAEHRSVVGDRHGRHAETRGFAEDRRRP